MLEETLSSREHSTSSDAKVDEADLLNESREQLAALTEKFDQCQAAQDNEIAELKRRCSEFEIIESGKDVLEKRCQVLEMEVDELNKEKNEIQDR